VKLTVERFNFVLADTRLFLPFAQQDTAPYDTAGKRVFFSVNNDRQRLVVSFDRKTPLIDQCVDLVCKPFVCKRLVCKQRHT